MVVMVFGDSLINMPLRLYLMWVNLVAETMRGMFTSSQRTCLCFYKLPLPANGAAEEYVFCHVCVSVCLSVCHYLGHDNILKT